MTLSRRQLLTAAGAASLAGPAQVTAAARHVYTIDPQPIGDGLWMVEGSTEYFSNQNGGAIVNCVLIETNAGMVIVDSGPSRRYGEVLRAAASKLSNRGIAAVINTHHHPDHYFGNQVFSDKPIYGLADMISAAKSDGDAFSDNMYRLLGDWMRGTEPLVPQNAITSSALEIGGRTFKTFPLSGHTKADLALIDVQTGILITGDLAFLDRAPTTPHAELAKWREAIDVLKGISARSIVPGHGPLDTDGRSLDQTLAYLDWLEATLRKAAAEGLDMVEIMDIRLPEDYARMGAMPQEFYRSIAHIYPGIETEVLPRAN